MEQNWAEWEGDLERNRAITSGQYINTHYLKVICVCVCVFVMLQWHPTYWHNMSKDRPSAFAQQKAEGHSESGSQGEQRNGSSVTVWSWLRHWHWQRGRRSHPQDRCQGRGQASRFLSPRMVSHDPTTLSSRLSLPRSRPFRAFKGQTLVQQTLDGPGVLLEEGWVENRCVHGDIYKYPIASLRLPLVIHSMGFFPLEQFRNDILRPAFDQVNN